MRILGCKNRLRYSRERLVQSVTYARSVAPYPLPLPPKSNQEATAQVEPGRQRGAQLGLPHHLNGSRGSPASPRDTPRARSPSCDEPKGRGMYVKIKSLGGVLSGSLSVVSKPNIKYFQGLIPPAPSAATRGGNSRLRIPECSEPKSATKIEN